VTDEERVKVLADGLNDVISVCKDMQIKGALKHGKLLPVEVVEYTNLLARQALSQTGIRVRKTGRV